MSASSTGDEPCLFNSRHRSSGVNALGFCGGSEHCGVEWAEHDCVCSRGWEGHHVSQIPNNKFWQVKNVWFENVTQLAFLKHFLYLFNLVNRFISKVPFFVVWVMDLPYVYALRTCVRLLTPIPPPPVSGVKTLVCCQCTAVVPSPFIIAVLGGNSLSFCSN